MSDTKPVSTKLEFYIGEKNGFKHVIWTNGAARPATEVETALANELARVHADMQQVLETMRQQLAPLAAMYFTRTQRDLCAPAGSKGPPSLPEPSKPAEQGKVVYVRPGSPIPRAGETGAKEPEKKAEPAKETAKEPEKKEEKKPEGESGNKSRLEELRAKFAERKAQAEKDKANDKPRLPG
jgi:hypothetical protein